jgi:N utilization substance protein B
VTRQQPRTQALGALYAAEAQRRDEPDVTDLSARATRLVQGVWEHRAELDEAIAAASSGWRLERMPAVDRNLLRLALFELRYTDTPVGVVASEAVKLAKEYSTERSGSFVNGVIAALAEHREPASGGV